MSIFCFIIFLGYFRISPYRGVEEREWIANKLNITPKQVTVWFQVITQHLYTAGIHRNYHSNFHSNTVRLQRNYSFQKSAQNFDEITFFFRTEEQNSKKIWRKKRKREIQIIEFSIRYHFQIFHRLRPEPSATEALPLALIRLKVFKQHLRHHTFRHRHTKCHHKMSPICHNRIWLVTGNTILIQILSPVLNKTQTTIPKHFSTNICLNWYILYGAKHSFMI